jgi:hypothetical protein
MLFEDIKGHDVEGSLMCRFQDDERSGPIHVSSQPVMCRDTPAITRHKAGEAVLGCWSGEVVSDLSLMLEELGCDHGADRVATDILRPG